MNEDPRHQAACRLHGLLARDGRSAVIIRRGPTRHVCLVRWWLGTDTLEVGQWMKVRIYEHRADLSPDGELLVYFAARHHGRYPAWTAVSRPPYFTALALWPKQDCWGGGGIFDGARTLGLNHAPNDMVLAPDFKLPKGMRVERVAAWAGAGEDSPIEDERLWRYGWRRTVEGRSSTYRQTGPHRWELETPETHDRPQPAPPDRHKRSLGALTLRRELRAIGVVDGPWRLHDFTVLHGDVVLRHFAACDWADWQSNGDLLVACDGRLYRLPARVLDTASVDPLADARVVGDLRPLRFEQRVAPREARIWP